jgi:hypothetical protein
VRRARHPPFIIRDVFEALPISQHGNMKTIAAKFGGANELVETVSELQRLLYAA